MTPERRNYITMIPSNYVNRTSKNTLIDAVKGGISD